jgi:pyridoxamine 5'-phosphate oxidase
MIRLITGGFVCLKVLIDGHSKALEQFEESKDVPLPNSWGGYLLVPDEFEFWQGNNIRLHDRLRFRRPNANETDFHDGVVLGENGWIIERLAP